VRCVVSAPFLTVFVLRTLTLFEIRNDNLQVTVSGQVERRKNNCQIMNLEYNKNRQVIESLYAKLGLANEFEKDNYYLENAFNEINKIWIDNFNDIESVKYLLIAEAPLWGQKKKYIYNHKTNNTQFFYRSDLETTFNIKILDKREFIKTCRNIGLLIVDISPFPLNTNDTRINYGKNKNGSRKLTQKEYKELVRQTLPTFFNRKINLISQKKSSGIKVFFRYARVKDTFQDLICDTLIQNGLIKKQEDIGEISQMGGGIDRVKFKKIINENKTRTANTVQIS
ncbi:hypothetical protein, partial [Draconibacterium mangrovi]|uniref:hypothetical protein n=1 Tax=Draconibacterium mangrovi TaxID=2697469 RepID=UPI001953A079